MEKQAKIQNYSFYDNYTVSDKGGQLEQGCIKNGRTCR